jgi:hypothetical protein
MIIHSFLAKNRHEITTTKNEIKLFQLTSTKQITFQK